jgi:Esterase/lipase
MLFEQIKLRENNDNVMLSAYILKCGGELVNTQTRPAILICPGGAYRSCSDRESEPIAMAFLAEGYQTFVLHYSVGTEENFNNALEDANKAIRLLNEKKDEWNIDTDKIAVLGFSAGGHLAASLATMGEIRPSALILGYPCILESMSEIFAFSVPGVEDKVDGKTPPAFLFSTCEDELVPIENTIHFIDELNKQHIPFEAHIFQKGKHGLSLGKPLTSSGFACFVNKEIQTWFPMSVAWLHGIFGDFKADEEFRMIGVEIDGKFYGLDTAIKVLWQNDLCKQLILEYIPAFYNEEVLEGAKDISLNILHQYAGQLINDSCLNELGEKLKEIPR